MPDLVGAGEIGAGERTGHLDAKTRELISLALAVTTRCDGCITGARRRALKHGASREEIAEALGVAVAMNAGAALVYSARVMDAVDQHNGGGSHVQCPSVSLLNT